MMIIVWRGYIWTPLDQVVKYNNLFFNFRGRHNVIYFIYAGGCHIQHEKSTSIIPHYSPGDKNKTL